MITIRSDEGGFAITGHAGYAQPGQDIVCAAISALLQTFVAAAEELTADKLNCVISAGNAVIRYTDLSEQGQLLMRSFFIGVQMIAESYPQYVRLV